MVAPAAWSGCQAGQKLGASFARAKVIKALNPELRFGSVDVEPAWKLLNLPRVAHRSRGDGPRLF